MGIIAVAQYTIKSISESLTYDGSFDRGTELWSQNKTTYEAVTSTQVVKDSTSEYGGNVLSITGDKWIYAKDYIPLRKERIYKLTFRAKQKTQPTNATDKNKAYAGFYLVDINKTAVSATGIYGGNSYFAASSRTLTSSWQEFTGYASVTSTPKSGVTTLPSNAAYFKPMFIVNYSGGNGVALVDILAYEDITDAWDLEQDLNNKVDNDSESVFNALTDNGRIQGIYMENNQLYINGQYINAKNLTVKDINNNLTLGVDENGNVTIRAANLSIGSKSVATNESVDNLENRVSAAESKVSETAITNTIKKNFYTKTETENQITSKGYQTESQIQQKIDSFEVKVGSSGGYNELFNTGFNAGILNWEMHNSPNIDFNPDAPNTFGKVIAITGTASGQDSGINQSFTTIPGKEYTCSFYAEPHGVTNVPTAIGIDGVSVINIANNSFRRYNFTFTATKTSYTFVAYSKLKNGTFYLGRPMINAGEILYEYSPNTNEILSTTAQFTTEGMTISSLGAGVQTNINTDGMNITRTTDGASLLKTTSNGVRVKGGMFYVEDDKNGYTYFWGRDIVINDQRALVGTNATPESSLSANKLYINYDNDFINGVELQGNITNWGKPILTENGYNSYQDNGYLSLSNGFILQWGKIKTAIGNGDHVTGLAFSYPIKFPNAVFHCDATILNVDDGYGGIEYLYDGGVTKYDENGGYFWAKNRTENKWGTTMTITWFAIGK